MDAAGLHRVSQYDTSHLVSFSYPPLCFDAERNERLTGGTAPGPTENEKCRNLTIYMVHVWCMHGNEDHQRGYGGV